jgi:predicted transcriptional regulator
MVKSMSDVAEKWGRPVAERGFAQIPNYLLLLNQFLDREHRLSPVELLVLLQLIGSWWKKDDLPFPSMGTLATRCGVSDRQIQRAVNQLVAHGLLQRVKRRTRGIIASNAYDLSPLADFLGEVAKAFPNEFPRNVDRARVKEISSRLAATSPNAVVAPTVAAISGAGAPPRRRVRALPRRAVE